MSNLYSFIMDFRGGTYISQVKADAPQQAMINWANSLDYKQIKYLGQKNKQHIIETIEEEFDTLTTISTVKNIWIFQLLLSTGFATIHFIQTVDN